MIEQISPELVLICPELRVAALASLREPERGADVDTDTPALEPAPAPGPPILVQALVYTAWQMLVSSLTALTAVTTVAVLVLLIGFIVH
jgi:hypothetical protein